MNKKMRKQILAVVLTLVFFVSAIAFAFFSANESNVAYATGGTVVTDPDAMLADRYSPVDVGDGIVAAIIHKPTGLALTNTGLSNVVAEEAVFSDAQLWTFVKTNSKNAYKLVNHLDNRCLDIDSAKTDNATNVMIWDDNGLDCQRYYFYEVDGSYCIRPVHCTNDRILDVYSETNNVQIYEYIANNPQQQFAIVVPGEEEEPSSEQPSPEESSSEESSSEEPLPEESSSEEPSQPSDETSSDAPATPGDAGIIVFAILAVISLSAIVVFKKIRRA